MIGPVVSLPRRGVTAWHAETDPKYARAWLDSLPLADAAESARELYQTLYTINRQELSPQTRFELMEMYQGPVATASSALQAHVTSPASPLTPKRRQLAEFIRRLDIEMANGFKCGLVDLIRSSISWGKKSRLVSGTGGALWYLGEVLLKSYQAYMPYPAGVWREIHEMYRYAEQTQREGEPIDISFGGTDEKNRTISENYRRILLLGLANPYQLPQNECNLISQLLVDWSAKTRLDRDLNVDNAAGQFVVDLKKDAPPTPFPRGSVRPEHDGLRVLNAIELVHAVHGYVNRLRKGESPRSLELGLELLGDNCSEMFRRLVRSWGLVARRRHTRLRRNNYVFVCVGINALHFFSSSQKPFVPPEERGVADAAPVPTDAAEGDANRDEAYVDLDEPIEDPRIPDTAAIKPDGPAQRPTEFYRVDRWHVRDLGPQGMSMVRQGEAGTNLRIGDLVGIERIDDIGQWNVGVARWLKSPDQHILEIGVELLAPEVAPVAVKRADIGPDHDPRYTRGLLLPAVDALQRPASVVVPRGVFRPEADLFIITEEDAPARRIRPVKVLERTGSFEHLVFAERTG